MNKWTRIITALSGIALFIVIFIPIWRIDLDAPQYPEGLRMLIHSNKLAGDVDIINGLNHYIGMQTLHAENFIEFTLLPYIIGFYALLFILVAAIGNKKLLYTLLVLFATFGVLAMVDFWRWEYNYGHNLDPNAAIIVPGMAYQPPLIGYKQLLNFAAYSMPDIGGWIFIAVGVLTLITTIIEVRLGIQLKKSARKFTTLLLLVFPLAFLSSCNAQPKAIKLGVDQCHYCKMTISDARFPSEVVTQKGKVYIFDDIHCMLEFLKENATIKNNVKDIYFSDYLGAHSLILANDAHLYKSEDLRSPMGGNTAAFASADSMNIVADSFSGKVVSWSDLSN